MAACNVLRLPTPRQLHCGVSREAQRCAKGTRFQGLGFGIHVAPPARCCSNADERSTDITPARHPQASGFSLKASSRLLRWQGLHSCQVAWGDVRASSTCSCARSPRSSGQQVGTKVWAAAVGGGGGVEATSTAPPAVEEKQDTGQSQPSAPLPAAEDCQAGAKEGDDLGGAAQAAGGEESANGAGWAAMTTKPVQAVAPPPDLFHVVRTSGDSRFDIDYLGESTRGDMKVPRAYFDSLENEGWRSEEENVAAVDMAMEEARDAESLLAELGVPLAFPHGLASRGVFCSRTLNLRSITTIGYDMDYTLIHYNVNAWEGRAYDYAKENLKAKGYPVDGLTFDPDLVIRGLIMDKHNGNLVKADRFGYVKRAIHGTTMLSNRAISELYGRELVDLRNEGRWEFLNTLFSVSEAVIYMQMVDRLNEGILPPEVGPGDYEELYKVVAKALFRAHVEGQLKAEIMTNPDHFVELDEELPLTLLDQREAGKRLLLITNSDYQYTNKMMAHSFDRFLPGGMSWRKLFDMVIVSARKPEFFNLSINHPLYEIVTEDGLMRPCFKASSGGLYCGGSAQMVEKTLGFHGDETMYVGDHIYTDVSQSKVHLRWRTALICREIEKEVEALAASRADRQKLIELMDRKEAVGDVFNQLRLAFQRRCASRPAQTEQAMRLSDPELTEDMQRLLLLMERLDAEIGPLLEHDGRLFNSRWGYLSRAGLWDKSHLTRQVEKYADIYTSRVSNFLHYTPFMYFRSKGQSLAHDNSEMWCDLFHLESASLGEARHV